MSEQSIVILVDEATAKENTTGSPLAVADATVTQDGVAENIPDAIVTAHAPADTFPTEDIHDPL